MKQIILLDKQKSLGYAEKINYIKVLSNGTYGLCEESEAEGIAYNGITYKLYGKGDNVKGDIVSVTDIDLGVILKDINILNSISFVTLAENGKIDEMTADEHKMLFNDFAVDTNYRAGQIRKYGNKLYKCILDHTSQTDWTPDVAVSLWKQITDPSESYPLWSQPVGAHDCYMKGDRVTYNNKKYVSTLDNNTWQPDAHGWEEIKE